MTVQIRLVSAEMTSLAGFVLVLMWRMCDGLEYIDLSYDIWEGTAHWPTTRPYTKEVVGYGYTAKEYWYASNDFCMSEHSGTHLDAPIHFAEGKWSTTEIPLKHLIAQGISVAAAQFIVDYGERTAHKVFGVGLDTPSLDHGPSKEFITHQVLASANIYGLENVANLDKLPAKGFDVLVMPMKLRGGSGGPARILAMLPGASSSNRLVVNSGVPVSAVFSYIFSMVAYVLMKFRIEQILEISLQICENANE